MPKVAAIAKLTAAEGQRDALVKVMDQLIDAAADEAGTEIYVLHLVAKNQDVIWFYELYTDNDALAAHSSSDTMKAIGASGTPMVCLHGFTGHARTWDRYRTALGPLCRSGAEAIRRRRPASGPGPGARTRRS